MRRLVNNEPNLGDLVQQRRDSYKIAQQLDDEGFSEEDLDNYENSGMSVTFEDADDFMEAINSDTDE